MSERNHNTRSRSTDSEGDAYPGYVTAHEVLACEASSFPVAQDLHLDPLAIVDIGGGGDSASNNKITPLTGKDVRKTLPVLVNGAKRNDAGGVVQEEGDTSSDLENCDDAEVNALRK